jgi:hypothetical protein
MDSVWAKDHIVSLFFEGDHTLTSINFECRTQSAVNQDRYCGRIPVGLGSVQPSVAIRVDRPFQLDIGLVSEAPFTRHKLADKPSGARHLIERRVAEIKRLFCDHLGRLRIASDHDRSMVHLIGPAVTRIGSPIGGRDVAHPLPQGSPTGLGT